MFQHSETLPPRVRAFLVSCEVPLSSKTWVTVHGPIQFSLEFATGVSLCHCLISRVMGVLTLCSIFGFVVLCDAVLFPLLNALPIGFEGDVQQSILSAKR